MFRIFFFIFRIFPVVIGKIEGCFRKIRVGTGKRGEETDAASCRVSRDIF